MHRASWPNPLHQTPSHESAGNVTQKSLCAFNAIFVCPHNRGLDLGASFFSW